MRKNVLFIIASALFGFLAVAQKTKLDSIYSQLEADMNDTTRCNLLILVIESESDLKKSKELVRSLENTAKANLIANKENLLLSKYNAFLAKALSFKGLLSKRESRLDESIGFFKESYYLYEKIKDKSGMAFTLNEVGLIASDRGQSTEALQFFEKTRKLSEEIGDKASQAAVMNNMATVYERNKDFENALEYYRKTIKIAEELGDKEAMASFLSNMAIVYSQQGDTVKSMKQFEKAKELWIQSGNKYGLANCLTNIGATYNYRDAYKALEAYSEALKYAEETNYEEATGIILFRMARLNFRMNNKSKAKEQALKSLAIQRKLEIASEMRETSALLSSIFESEKNYEKAFEYFELQMQMRDLLNIRNFNKKATNQKLNDEYKLKMISDSLQNSRIKKVAILGLKEERTKSYTLLCGLFLIAIFTGIMFRILKLAGKQKKLIELQKQDVELQKERAREQQEEILSSIRYAKRIQDSLLPKEAFIAKKLDSRPY